MAKKIAVNTLVKSAQELVTSREETRAGFIAMALEKNYIAVPYIEEAKALKVLASQMKRPKDLLKVHNLRAGLLTASGLSEKSLNYLTEDDRTLAIKGLSKNFLNRPERILLTNWFIDTSSPKAMRLEEKPETLPARWVKENSFVPYFRFSILPALIIAGRTTIRIHG